MTLILNSFDTVRRFPSAVRARIGGLVVAVIVLTVACGATNGPSSKGASAAQLQVVASTDVYGDIAEQVAGDHARVRALITDPDADPHSFEPSTRDQLALSKADIVIENGGGYDDFIDRMLAAVQSDAVVIDVVELSDAAAAEGEEVNEHVWYDFATMQALADRLSDALSNADPSAAAGFRSNADTFIAELANLDRSVAQLRSHHAGAPVVITEPVPSYLLTSAGLIDRTPDGFSAAVEEGTGVPPRVIARTEALLEGHQVDVLVENPQTTGPVTGRVIADATANGIPVVSMTETLPEGLDYVSWMRDNVSALRDALG